MIGIYKKSKSQEEKIVDNIRSLSIDMIDEAKSGHPGIALGAAPIIYTLFAHHLKYNVKDPNWINRDRFILSAGHGSALLYATLFMAGYQLDIEDLKKFRQIDSITPGHPEYGVTPGVEMSTGPLGQGFASAVGMAIAERYLGSLYNHLRDNIFDYHTYVLCGDGDLMEGISYEAASLAGNLMLNKLIVLYDSNNVTLDGTIHQSFSDNIPARFRSMGWNVITITNGENIGAIHHAIEKAKNSTEKPTLIKITTTIGKYSKYQGTNKVHGSPLDKEDISEIKKKLNVRDVPFAVSKEAKSDFQAMIKTRVEPLYENWKALKNTLEKKVKDELTDLSNHNISIKIKDFSYKPSEDKMEETRQTSGKILNSIANEYPFLIGGSADVTSSTKAYLKEKGDFSRENYLGRNIWFGVREHAMGAILNGLALSGLRPFGSTFLAFSDYLKPSIRMACLMKLPVLYIFTHDSITIGEDGPTHQPVEQLVSLRSIPNLEVYRPADANEVIGVYKTVLESKDHPSAIILGRNKVPILSETSVTGVENGAYIIRKEKNINQLDGILIATGEEVSKALTIANNLQIKGLDLRVISMPSIERFKSMPKEYQEELLPITSKKIVIEAASSYSWYSFVHNEKYLININQFGYSGKKTDVEKKLGFDLKSIEKTIENLLK